MTEPAAVLLLDPLQLQAVGFSLLLHLLQLLHHLLLLLRCVLKSVELTAMGDEYGSNPSAHGIALGFSARSFNTKVRLD